MPWFFDIEQGWASIRARIGWLWSQFISLSYAIFFFVEIDFFSSPTNWKATTGLLVEILRENLILIFEK